MPLCFVRLQPVDYYRVTDRLSIASVTTNLDPVSYEHCVGSDIRVGRAFFIKNASVQVDPFDDGDFFGQCQSLRKSQLIRFVGCICTDLIREEERAILEKVCRHVDYLVLDLSDLPVELWGSYIGMIRPITRRIGIYIRSYAKRPYNVLAPWIAKAVCEVGIKGVVFIDGAISLVSEVQDVLEGHRFSEGCGRIIAVITTPKLLDLEPLVIESRRRWCTGICMQDVAVDGRFDMWKCAYEMIGQGKGLRSMLYAFGERWIECTMACLQLEEALQQEGNIVLHKARVEELVAEAEQKSIGSNSGESLKKMVEPLLSLANSKLGSKRPFSFLPMR